MLRFLGNGYPQGSDGDVDMRQSSKFWFCMGLMTLKIVKKSFETCTMAV
jgi:hypothetical protein